ncbi:hypothetical protein BDR04DRAFT_1158481 [Suillus decipiens]|nr:hypothetical protein BDR04DRAFT_1158481 [Suillus decipiens]
MAQPKITLQADNAKAHWQDIKVDVLLHYLIENQAASGDGENLTMSTFNAAAAAINTDTAIQTIGPQKTGKMVKMKWTLLKKIFNQIEIYCNVSGFHWDNEQGAGIEGTAAASVWDTHVDPKKSHIAICPFCNKEWPPYDNMQMILGDNSSIHRRSSLHPGTRGYAPSVITTDDVLDSIDGGLGLLEMDVDTVSAGVAYSNNVPDMSPDLMMPPSALLHGSSTTTHRLPLKNQCHFHVQQFRYSPTISPTFIDVGVIPVTGSQVIPGTSSQEGLGVGTWWHTGRD